MREVKYYSKRKQLQCILTLDSMLEFVKAQSHGGTQSWKLATIIIRYIIYEYAWYKFTVSNY